MGNAYVEKQDYDKAIEYYKKAIELKPDLTAAHNNMGLAYELKRFKQLEDMDVHTENSIRKQNDQND